MFLVRLTTEFPPDMDPEFKADLLAREREYGQANARAGKVLHLWRVVGPKLCNISVVDMTVSELQESLAGLPMRPWINVEIELLDHHPSDIKRA